MKLTIDKMFDLAGAFMFRFEAEPGQPQQENHKIIMTIRVGKTIGNTKIKELMRHFLSRVNIQWQTFTFNLDTLGSLPVYHVVDRPDICISPSIITHQGTTKKIVWVMMKQDLDEINGTTQAGNHRVNMR